MLIARYLNAPMLLLLWQVAPVDFKTDAAGRIRFSVGAGKGAYTFRDYAATPAGMGCTGPIPASPPRTESDPWNSSGVSVEAWPGRDIRVQAAVGSIGADRTRTFGGVQVSLEKKDWGVGAGVAASGPDHPLRPSFSARAGSLEGVSLRADYGFPDVTLGLRGAPRVGLGLHQGRTRSARLLVGAAMTPVDSTRKVGGFLDLEVPLGFLFDRKAGFSLFWLYAGTRQGNQDKSIHALLVGGWVEP